MTGNLSEDTDRSNRYKKKAAVHWNKSFIEDFMTEFSASVLKKFRTYLFEWLVHFWRVTLESMEGGILDDNELQILSEIL